MAEKSGMDVLDVIGNFGRLQKEILLLIALRPFFSTPIYFLVQFTSSNVDYWCSPITPYQNLSVQEWKDCCVPKNNERSSQCQRYEFNFTSNLTIDNTTLVNCHQWDYGTEKTMSLRSDWDLVCKRKWLLSLMYSMFFLGNIISYPIAGYVSDRIGRRPVIVFGNLGLAIATLVVSLSNTVTLFIIFRFLTGFFYSSIQLYLETVYTEMCGRKERALHSFVSGIGFAFSSVATVFISKYLTSWRHFSFLGCATLLYMFVTYKFCPESLRWLIVSGKRERAKKLLESATQKNGIRVYDIDSVIKSLEDKGVVESQEKSSMRDLFKFKKLIFVYIMVLLSCVTNKLITSGFIVSLRTLGGNFYTNFLIIAFSNFVVAIFRTAILYQFTKRRLTLLVAFASTGILFLLSTAIGKDLLWLRTAVAMMGLFSNSLTTQALLLFVSEIFPTKFRAQGKSISSTVGRIGSLLSSFTDILNQTYGNNASWYLFGALALLTAFGYVFVPEVNNTNLPDSPEEANINLNLKPTVNRQAKSTFSGLEKSCES